MKRTMILLGALVFTGVGYAAAWGPSVGEKNAQDAAYDALVEQFRVEIAKEGVSKGCCLAAVKVVIAAIATLPIGEALDFNFGVVMAPWIKQQASTHSCGERALITPLMATFGKILNEHLPANSFSSAFRSATARLEILQHFYNTISALK